jgi:hypothetical protein
MIGRTNLLAIFSTPQFWRKGRHDFIRPLAQFFPARFSDFFLPFWLGFIGGGGHPTAKLP